MREMTNAGRQAETFFQRFGSMVNFVTILCGLLISIMYVGSWRTGIELGIATNAKEVQEVRDMVVAEQNARYKWQMEHMEFHRARALDNGTTMSRIDNRLIALEGEKPRYENTIFRVTTLETAVNQLIKAKDTTDDKLTKIATDVAIIKDQLTRKPPG